MLSAQFRGLAALLGRRIDGQVAASPQAQLSLAQSGRTLGSEGVRGWYEAWKVHLCRSDQVLGRKQCFKGP